jgi:hypothetical protein
MDAPCNTAKNLWQYLKRQAFKIDYFSNNCYKNTSAVIVIKIQFFDIKTNTR